RGREGYREGCARPACVPFRHRVVTDANCRFVVEDRAKSPTIGDGRVGRGAEVYREGLIPFAEPVAVDRHGDRSAGLPGGNRQCAGGGLVVAAGGGGVVGGGVGDGNR